MNVVILAQYYPPDMGGGATRAMNAAKGLNRNGIHVTVVTAFPHYPQGNIPKKYRWKPFVVERQGSIRVIRTFVPPIKSIGIVNRIVLFVSFVLSCLQSLFLLGAVDVLFASNPNIISVFPATMFRRIKGCIIAQNVDDLWPETLHDLGARLDSVFYRCARTIASIAYGLSDVIIPISPGYVRAIRDGYGVSSQKMRVIQSGVDTSLFERGNSSEPDREGVFRVLYIGAFSPAYNFDQVFESARILKNHTDIEFTIQGGGELWPHIRRLSKRYDGTNVYVVNKIVSREEVSRLLKLADALLLPLCGRGSIELGISSKLYEYQAMAKPIICCSRGESARYIIDTDSGVVVEPGDFKSLARAVIMLKNNPVLAKQVGENGYHQVHNNMSIDQVGMKLRDVIRAVMIQYGNPTFKAS